ncbi:ABC transporter C family member 10-like [Nymphaea colorata]|nr:ABC transporter C family member 10-like [Nymphaea colorata]XP_031495022.1 ABC transporter C family member 10-like [Nymphaea colorata]XP_031495023.1 ABC transporter C family member 10-like [Nymphaea colorata]XP_031495024.1 ABC transporter C family member 10-like [Nymphaea colorata]
MELLTGVWVAFCGEPESSNTSECGRTRISAYPEILCFACSSLCVKNGVCLCISILLLLMFFFNLIHKGSEASGRTTHSVWFSCLRKFSAIYNGTLGLSYSVLGFWIFLERWGTIQAVTPLNLWMVPLFQGLAWALLGLTISLRIERLEKTFLRLWSFISFLFSVFLTVASILVVVTDKKLSIKIMLDLLSLPGALLLLVCIRYSRQIEYSQTDRIDLFEPLNGENKLNLDGYVTPFSEASFFNRLSFWWLNSLMQRGWESPLEDKDMPKLCMEDQAQSHYALFTEKLNQQTEKKRSTSSSIFWTLVFCQRRELIVSGFFALLKIFAVSSGPILLNAFIRVAEGNESFKYEGYVLAISFFFTKVLESLSQRQWYFRTRRIGLQLRSLLSAAIYEKQLRVSNAAKMKHSSGEIMNYLNVDAYRIGEFPFFLHQTWTACLQLSFALAILYNAVGLATLSALFVVILTVLCNAPLAKLMHKFQTKLMQAQDERLKVASEALVNMKVLKLYAWEMHFKSVIEQLREVEHNWISAFQLRKAYTNFLFWVSPVLVTAVTFITCYLIEVPLQASNVFTSIATLRLVQDPVRSIPYVLGVTIQAKVAFTRIVNFLDAPELGTGLIERDISGTDHEYSIYIKSATLAWEVETQKPTLRNVSVVVKPGQRVAICGEVGSGKSSLLAAILGEVPIIDGHLQVFGTIAYVSQTPWIQSGTIRDNILFGSCMNEKKYEEVVRKCSLEKDLEMLPFGDLTEIGERGVNLSGGQKQRIQLARAVYQDADIFLLDDPFSAVDAHTANSLFNECIMGALLGKTVLLVTHQVDFLPAFDAILLMSEGDIIHAAPFHKLLDSSAEFQNLVNAHKDTMSSERLCNVSCERKRFSSASGIRKEYVDTNLIGKVFVANQLVKQEEKERGDMGFKPYTQYLNQNKGFFFFFLTVLTHSFFVGTQILQNSWMAANVQSPHVSKFQLISVYSVLGFSGAVSLFLRSIFVVVLGLRSSKSLFAQLLKSLFRAPMSFYDSTPLGRIVSRMSSDLSIIDLDVPFCITFTCIATINASSNLTVLTVFAWPVLFVAIPIIYISSRLQRYYFASSRELMRINGITKSIVANHLSESMSGAMTIRAFKAEDRFFSKALELIDKNASPFFHNFAAIEWLIQRLEALSAVVLLSSAFAMLMLPSGTFSPGFIGMALSYGLSLNGSLVMCAEHFCVLGNHIISVERVNQYMYLPSEASEMIESSQPAANWPSVGKVEIQDLKIRYRPDTQLVLQGITCTFQGGHKIGIVGRTGSGKTTLISALFRLVEPAAGKIIIDDLDISAIGLHDLRSRLGIIPQDPTFFQGTVRYNMDPLQQHSDHEIWEVLDKCQLRETVQEKKDGLDSLVVEGGSNWSMGQRQLFCLGRALLRRSKILVLDEATASVDNSTDATLQKTIRTEFANCTVITVAHRIPTVMDCTMVLAISDGKLAEFDGPLNLMEREGSLFRELVKEYWSHASSSAIK